VPSLNPQTTESRKKALEEAAREAENEALDLIDILGEIADSLADLVHIERNRAIKEGAMTGEQARKD